MSPIDQRPWWLNVRDIHELDAWMQTNGYGPADRIALLADPRAHDDLHDQMLADLMSEAS